MEFWEGKICPVCGKTFTENDDIVFCPDCGTAHHRACWNSQGKCFFADEHAKGNFATENATVTPPPKASAPSPENGADNAPQRDAEGRIICPNCGQVNLPFFRVCMNCGADLTGHTTAENEAADAQEPHNQSAYPPPPGAETAGENAGTDVSSDDLTCFCRNYSREQINALESAGSGNTVFSLSAFFFSFLWLLYRKVTKWGMILAGIVGSPLLVLSAVLSFRCSDLLVSFSSAQYSSNAEYYNAINALMNRMLEENYTLISICMAIFFILLLAGMFFCGFRGLKLYYDKATADIKMIKTRIPAQQQYFMAARGGSSFIQPILVLMLFFALANTFSYIGLFISSGR